MNKNKPRVKLHHWMLVGNPEDGQMLTGYPTGHPHLRDGELIYTSRVVEVRENEIETRNTIYELGIPLNKEAALRGTIRATDEAQIQGENHDQSRT